MNGSACMDTCSGLALTVSGSRDTFRALAENSSSISRVSIPPAAKASITQSGLAMAQTAYSKPDVPTIPATHAAAFYRGGDGCMVG